MVAITYGAARALVTSQAGKSLASRVWAALIAARAKQAEREVARFRHLAMDWDRDIASVGRDDLPFRG
jgi:hypothetical protein